VAPSELAIFRNARRDRNSLLTTGLLLLVLGAVSIFCGFFDPFPPTVAPTRAPREAVCLGAALLIAAAGFLSSGLVAWARVESPGDQLRPEAFRLDVLLGQWGQALVGAFCSLLALMALVAVWRTPTALPWSSDSIRFFAAVLLFAAFPLLVAERTYAQMTTNRLLDAPALDRLLRVPLASCLLLGVMMCFASLGFGWPSGIETIWGFVLFVVALEVLLRCAATLYAPFAPLHERRGVGDSLIAGFFRLENASPASIPATIERHFGIDLSRSWALAYLRQMAVPFVLAMAFAAWILTGVTSAGLSERLVYERLGEPVEVFGPGLHVHLPWPLGVVRPVELGAIHELPIAFSNSGESLGSATEIDTTGLVPGSAEADPPRSADRLWDDEHPFEASYLLASETQGRQSFQIANADMRVVYRVGLSDAAARDYLYNVAEPETLLRALTGKLLTRYFAGVTLIDVLAGDRTRFAENFRRQLQAELDSADTGIEVLTIVVEAIHPPPGAASAYHEVQAAEISAHAQVSIERANAVRLLDDSKSAALVDRDDAMASASESASQATRDVTAFAADSRSDQRDPHTFLEERLFSRLTAGLSKSSLLLLDHRITPAAMPTIDLRKFGDFSGGSNEAGASGAESQDTSNQSDSSQQAPTPSNGNQPGNPGGQNDKEDD
jgi:regulator of protease activity HflC (stomatin/prohibitin superfamily)